MQLKNIYYLIRHGHAVSNVIGVCSSWPEEFDNPLTEAGRAEVAAAAETLKDKSIDLIVTSDIERAQQTAQLVGGKLNKENEIEIDARLREMGFGQFNGKAREEFFGYFKNETERIYRAVPGGESYAMVRDRVLAFMKDMERVHQGKHMVIVSHKCPLWIFQSIALGITIEEAIKIFPPVDERFNNAEIKVVGYDA